MTTFCCYLRRLTNLSGRSGELSFGICVHPEYPLLLAAQRYAALEAAEIQVRANLASNYAIGGDTVEDSQDLARHLDPVLLARDCGIEPDPWQQNLLRSSSLRVLMLCARQVGKTETAVCKALWTASMIPG
jgi:hypothetical protein